VDGDKWRYFVCFVLKGKMLSVKCVLPRVTFFKLFRACVCCHVSQPNYSWCATYFVSQPMIVKGKTVTYSEDFSVKGVPVNFSSIDTVGDSW